MPTISLKKALILRVRGSYPAQYRCKSCGAEWSPRLAPSGRRPPGWWKCPNLCNVHVVPSRTDVDISAAATLDIPNLVIMLVVALAVLIMVFWWEEILGAVLLAGAGWVFLKFLFGGELCQGSGRQHLLTPQEQQEGIVICDACGKWRYSRPRLRDGYGTPVGTVVRHR